MTMNVFSSLKQAKSCGAYALVIGLILGFSVTSAHAAIAVSTFDTNDELWTGLACTNPGGLCVVSNAPLGAKFNYEAMGGNTGGWISAEDPDSFNTARFIAPSEFRDNLNLDISDVVANRRILSFDAIAKDIDGTGGFESPVAPIVTIENAGQALIYWAPVPLEEVWTSFIAPLYWEAGDTGLGEGWDLWNGATFENATEAHFTSFGTVTRLTILGEWLKDDLDVDVGGLDNVRLSAVPVPAAAWLFGSALIGLVGIRRKK